MAKTLTRPLSGNMLKWIAAVSMVIDHIGVLFFPNAQLFRIIGRLAFPIFCFMIAEGCRYTKSKRRYFLSIAALALLCQTAHYLFSHSLYMCVLVTFSLSIPTVCALQYAKDTCFSPTAASAKLLSVLALAAAVAFAFFVNNALTVDYGFWGCMLPLFAAIAQPHGPQRAPDTRSLQVLSMGAGLLILSAVRGGIQFYSLAALPLLLLYSGKRGKRKMKYFFYIFYPAHFLLLALIHLLLR